MIAKTKGVISIFVLLILTILSTAVAVVYAASTGDNNQNPSSDPNMTYYWNKDHDGALIVTFRDNQQFLIPYGVAQQELDKIRNERHNSNLKYEAECQPVSYDSNGKAVYSGICVNRLNNIAKKYERGLQRLSREYNIPREYLY
jgi:hypothetical protein